MPRRNCSMSLERSIDLVFALPSVDRKVRPYDGLQDSSGAPEGGSRQGSKDNRYLPRSTHSRAPKSRTKPPVMQRAKRSRKIVSEVPCFV